MFPIFDSGFLVATPVGGQPTKFASLQGISVDMRRELNFASSQFQLPIKAAFGKGSIKCTAQAAAINGALVNELYFGKVQSAGSLRVKEQDRRLLSTATITVQPMSSTAFSFAADLGVVEESTGVRYTRVTGAPGPKQYSVSVVGTTGVYTFNAADVSPYRYIVLSYTDTHPSLGFTLNLSNEFMGVAPTFEAVLMGRFTCKEAVLKFNTCVSERLTIATQLEDFAVPQFEFEVLSDATGAVGQLSFAE